MAPASVASSAGDSRMDSNLSDSARYPSWPEEPSTITASKIARYGGTCNSTPDYYIPRPHPGYSKQEQPETPTVKKNSKPLTHVQLRPSAEKYNPNRRLRPQRSPAVPEAELNTSKLIDAFPGFSGCMDDVKPLSPNPFLAKANGHQLKMPSWAESRQPRVRDENDVSIAAETHSSPAKLGSKNTRFGGINNPKTRQKPQPHMYKHTGGLVQNVPVLGSASQAKPMAINAQGSLTSLPNGSTQPTLNIPPGTNLTDLFSGVVRQPPPMHTQQMRPRASRFASAAKTQTVVEPKAEEIPVPVDERNLLQSIEILQDRVAELEVIKAQLEDTNTNLDQKNFELEIEKRELTARRRSDSAVSAASVPDNASVDSKGQSAAHRRLVAEKNRFESTCWALQGQKDLLLRNVDTAEAATGKVTQELNQCKAQLASAQSSVELLQREKAAVGQQRAQAVAQLALANDNVENLSRERDSLLDENEQLKAHIAFLTQGVPDKENSTLEHSDFGHADADALEEEPIDMDTLSMMHQQQKREHLKEQPAEQEKPTQCHSRSLDSSHNITYLSYTGDSGICKVRKSLEQERKARQHGGQVEATRNASANHVNEQKDMTKAFEGQARQQSDSTVIKRPKRQSIPQDELTSGFILPDITFNLQPAMDSQAAALPAGSRPHLDIAQQNTAQSHAEQTDLLDLEPIQAQNQQAQPTAESPKLPLISDEELDITIYDEESSIRPSQPPDVALAVVLDSLQTELTSQRAQLARYQRNYDRQDVAINRRQRKQILAKIQALLESCDLKADQIYNLHDVIEGNKKQGQPITRDQVDNTLQSLGLDLPWEGIESTNNTRRRSTASSRSI
ncbi:MAG: hypothetical protein Q9216_001878 [Gyalolechia sp. 2 TL-2023]